MKKILTILAIATMLATTVSADFARVEVGAGLWKQTPNGTSYAGDSSGLLSVDGNYTSNEDRASSGYVWMIIKHPIPIVPNIRLEYVTVADEGMTEVTTDDTVSAGDYPTTIDMKQYDIIPYYNILDNTAWITLDVGLDIKVIETQSEVIITESAGPIAAETILSSDTAIVPLLYVRTRVEIPATNIGLETDVKYITDGDNTVYDIRAKIDYTLDFIPVVQPAFEVGYRVIKFDLEDADENTKTNLEFSGVYAGVMVRF